MDAAIGGKTRAPLLFKRQGRVGKPPQGVLIVWLSTRQSGDEVLRAFDESPLVPTGAGRSRGWNGLASLLAACFNPLRHQHRRAADLIGGDRNQVDKQ